MQRKRLSESSEEQSNSAQSEVRLHADLLQLWKKFLKTDNVSVDDDFFEKGGNSLLAMELHLEIQRLTGQTLSESVLFETATVRELAKRLSRSGGLRP